MNILAAIESIIETTEADVLATLVKVKAGILLAETDIKDALNWVAANAPQIASDVAAVENLVTQVGITSPSVQKAIADANTAVNAINAVAASAKAGASSAESIIAGYVAVKSATTAAAQASLAAVKAPTSGDVIPVVPS